MNLKNGEMITIKHRKGLSVHKITMFENIDEMPIVNYAQLEKNLLIDHGVGSSIADFDVRLEKMIQFITSGHKEKALNEVNNMRNLFYNISSDIRPDLDAFSTLIESINGKECTATESGINETSEYLKEIGFTKKLVDTANEKKKGLDEQIEVSFPNSSGGINYDLIGTQKRKLITLCDEILENESKEADIMKYDKIISDHISSKKFGGSQGDDVTFEKNFRKAIIRLKTQSNFDISKMTIYDFYMLAEIQKAA